MTVDEALAAAWTYCAPNRSRDVPFPRGFWPDVARVAMQLYAGEEIDFRPTMCERGNYPEPIQSSKSLRGLDLSKLEINI